MKKTNLLILFCVITFLHSNAQLSEDFEGVFPPTGWSISDNGIGTTIDWESTTDSFSGANAAFVEYDLTPSTEDWLISPQFTPDASSNTLSFFQKQGDDINQGSTFIIKISTTTNNLGDFTITVDTQSEDDFGDKYELKTVDLSSYNGVPIYIAFVNEQDGDGGDSWYIDKVSTVNPTGVVPNCATNPSPNIAGTDVINSATEISLSWDAPASGVVPTSYIINAGTNSGSLDFKTEVGNTNFTLTGVPYGATYYWEIIPQNYEVSADSCAEWNFTTEVSPGIPSNDSCASAVVISDVAYENTQDAIYATNNYPLNGGFVWACDGGSITGGMNDGVWYTFTTITGGTVNIDITEVSSAFDVEVAVYSGNCGAFTCVGFKDTLALGAGASESLVITVGATTQYWINVGSNSASVDDAEGAFKITLSVSGGTTLGVDKLNDQLAISLYPNPTNDTLNFSSIDIIGEIRIVNLLGQEVLKLTPNKQREQVDVSNLMKGLYLVSVQSGNRKGTYRILKK